MNMMNAALTARAVADELIDESLRAGKTIRLSIRTQSMRPTLAPGDRVTARAARPDELRIGNIVLVRIEEHWLAHRLIGRGGAATGQAGWLTQGDSSPDADDLWRPEQICAIIIAVERDGRSADLDSRRAHALGAFIALVSRARLRASHSHRSIRWMLGASVQASALIAQWVVGFK